MSHLVPLATARDLRAKIEAATNAILTEAGFDEATVKLTYGDRFQLKITSTPVNANEQGINLNDPAVQAYQQYAARYGWNPDAIGGTFDYAGEQYRLTGYNDRAKKYPFTADRVRDGKGYKFPESIVRGLISQPAEAAAA